MKKKLKLPMIKDMMAVKEELEEIKKSSETSCVKKTLHSHAVLYTFAAKFPLQSYRNAYSFFEQKGLSKKQNLALIAAFTLIPILPLSTVLALTAALIGLFAITLKTVGELIISAVKDKMNESGSMILH